ncbi:MAG: DUF393 domain-containing protein [Chloroflexaceae bacterium]|nr:DUF393 domain-containing protein [Chloroflexaceae bacterium]
MSHIGEGGSLADTLLQRGLSRRDFLKFCSAMAGTLALPPRYTPRIARALQQASRPPLVWLEYQDCAGNTESFLRASHPSVADLVLDILSVDYHETIMAAAGHQAEQALHNSITANKGKYLVVVEGSIPVADGGIYCTIGGRTALDHIREVSEHAAGIIATWAMMLSIHQRNPVVLFAADYVLEALLFWSMFLPLGARYSVDNAMNTAADPLPKQIVSGATVALVFQQCFIYSGSAAYKTKSPIWWPDGDAVYYALHFDQYATAIGQFFGNFPPELLKLMTFGALGFEWLGPLLLLIPFRVSLFRNIAIISFILLHLSFGLFFTLGIFPFLSIASWLAFIPSTVWDGLDKRTYREDRAGLTIYFDADCGFCKKVVHLLRTFLILPGTPLLKAQDAADPTIYEEMERINSWVVVDWQQHRHYQWEAIAYVCSLSPLWGWLAPLLRWGPFMAVGTNFYKFIATNRRLMGTFTAPLQFRPLEVRPTRLGAVVALSLLLLTSVWLVKDFVEQSYDRRREQPQDWVTSSRNFLNRRTFQHLDGLARFLRLDQSWSIFAPNPPSDDGWHVAAGTLVTGETVEVLSGKSEVSFEKPTLAQRNARYGNMQWRTFYINLNRSIGEKLYPCWVPTSAAVGMPSTERSPTGAADHLLHG